MVEKVICRLPDEIIYQTGCEVGPDQVLALYNDCGWTLYTNNPDRLISALHKSTQVITAWQDDRLVGLVRAVGDGETILYIQDLLVLNSHRRRGIGSALLEKLCSLYPHVRQKVLMTDAKLEIRQFYAACGFEAGTDKGLALFVKLDK